tara:strand:- start:442 stop:1044 length:603 start_codon:yes stop_codon:yes gene_type:complete
LESLQNIKMNIIDPFILASSSPRRKRLLKKAGFNFTVIESKVIENLDSRFPPEAMAEHWAREKAKSVSQKYPNKLVIGADTIINFRGKILGKPKDKIDSFKMLKMLSGKTHEVITGISFIHLRNDLDVTFNEISYISLRILSDQEINFYINNYNTLDKAGSYGIQSFFSIHVLNIKGCFYNIMGLPLSSLYTHLKSIQKK